MDAPAVRRARRADIDALLALEAHFPSDALTRRNLRYLLRRSSAAVWVVEVDGHVVGETVLLFRARSTVARLYSLVVDPAQRGRGIGRMLIALAEDAARTRGCRTLTLEVRSDNARALALYRRAGFDVARRIAGYYDDGAEALKMHKRLVPEPQPITLLAPQPVVKAA